MDDAQAMFDNWASDDSTSKYLAWETHKSVDDTRKILAEWIPEYDKPDYYHWVIECDGTIVGTIHFFNISEWNEKCELGYCIGPKWWNKGIVTEAVAELFHFGFEEIGFYKIYALHDTENVGSGRVMQKNHMKQEGYLHEHIKRKDGTRGDMAYYAILRKEWGK
jgi:ribosomal-protein-alanine N-acetyltransferase